MVVSVKTSELRGAALNWAIAKSEGFSGLAYHPNTRAVTMGLCNGGWRRLDYDTDWRQGGAIIDRLDGLLLKTWVESRPDLRCEAHIHNHDGNWIQFGPTLLIAAMRCYIASRLGEEVEVPENLLGY